MKRGQHLTTNTENQHKSILLTGVSGYVGGRLLPLLEAKGYRVRCLARQPRFVQSRTQEATEVLQGSALDFESLLKALGGVHTAYYLVHSMAASEDFEKLDRTAAENFARASRECGVGRIIYLGGLGSGGDLSPHLRSRHEVGEILKSSGATVIEFRASIIIGSGSLSFEMIRALVERLPVMVTPRWVSALAQPIAIDDLLQYLLAAAEIPMRESKVIEIGGTDRVSYGDLMREYARQRGLHRVMIPVPLLTPRLSSLWLGFVTPLYARTGRVLVESLRHPTVVLDPSVAQLFPINPTGVQTSIARALRNEDRELAQTRWADSVSSATPGRNWGGKRLGNRLVDMRSMVARCSPETAYRTVERIGGKTGWYYANWLWRLRGFLDLLLGGVGMRRGRRHPTDLLVGDVVDWWRVETLEPYHHIRFFSEMNLPGRAWLDFELVQHPGGTTIKQSAIYDPVGLVGLVYWYGIYPVHQLVFKGMLQAIARRAESDESDGSGIGGIRQSMPGGGV